MFVERSGSGNTGESPVIFSVEGVATGSALETGAEDEKNVLNDQRKPRARRKTLGEDDVMDINDALQSDLDRVLQGWFALLRQYASSHEVVADKLLPDRQIRLRCFLGFPCVVRLIRLSLT